MSCVCAVRVVRIEGTGQRTVRVGASGPQQREEIQPVAALGEIQVGDEHAGLVTRSLHEHSPVRVGDERRAVERVARRAVRFHLGAGAVRYHHEQPIRDAVADDHLLPERLRVEIRVVGGVCGLLVPPTTPPGGLTMTWAFTPGPSSRAPRRYSEAWT